MFLLLKRKGFKLVVLFFILRIEREKKIKFNVGRLKKKRLY